MSINQPTVLSGRRTRSHRGAKNGRRRGATNVCSPAARHSRQASGVAERIPPKSLAWCACADHPCPSFADAARKRKGATTKKKTAVELVVVSRHRGPALHPGRPHRVPLRHIPLASPLLLPSVFRVVRRRRRGACVPCPALRRWLQSSGFFGPKRRTEQQQQQQREEARESEDGGSASLQIAVGEGMRAVAVRQWTSPQCALDGAAKSNGKRRRRADSC
jgi:hypothetical protein